MYFISMEFAEQEEFKYVPCNTIQVKVWMFIVGDMDAEAPLLPSNSGVG